MPNPTIERILQKVHSIPPMPAAVERLCQLTQDPEVDAHAVTQVISTNEVLTSRILRVANSTFYGLSQKIGTVSQAIVVLGFQGVRSLALGVTAFGFRVGPDANMPLDREALWRHSLAVASAAREICQLLGETDSEEAFTAGLLHDIGKVVLMEFFREEYARVLREAAAGMESLQALEKKAFGVNNTEVGGELCNHWKMPPSLTRMVSEHHVVLHGRDGVSREDRKVVAIRVADNLARISQIGADGEPNVEADFLHVVETRDLLPEQLRQILLSLPEAVRKAEVFFDLAPVANHRGPQQGPPPDVAGVSLSDPREREVIRLLLLTMGYTLVPTAELGNPKLALAGVVADESLPADFRNLLQQRAVPVLDFARWRQERGGGRQAAHLSVGPLRQWLGKKLPRPSVAVAP